MRWAMAIVAAALLSGCHAAASETDVDVNAPISNFAPPVADPTPAPIRVLDNAVIRDLAQGKTDGVYLLDLRHVPAPMRLRIAAERTEAAACRQGGEDAGLACRRRDEMSAELIRKGWCWGPDAEVEADRHWVRRGPGCSGH